MRKHERKTIETVNTVTTQMTAEQKTKNPTPSITLSEE